MKVYSKYLFFFSLLLVTSFLSCGSDEEEFKGIKVASTRASAESEGLGMACNIIEYTKELLTDEVLEEILAEGIENGELDESVVSDDSFIKN